jgi:SAM-dependent methyltransferase
MKDIVENRARLRLGTKLRLVCLSLRQNGFLWTTLMGSYYLASAAAERAFASAHRHRRRRGLPGMNSPEMNRLIWENWNWSARGEEWTPSPAWKQSVIDCFLEPAVRSGDTVVEIGPGAGRWTEALLQRAGRLEGIDISEACVLECRRRFAGYANASFGVGNGSDLSGVHDDSVDTLWSFDVFVHINRPEFQSYASEFARVLKPGACGIIHHGAVAGAGGGWRGDVSQETVAKLLTEAGLVVESQVDSWSDAGTEYRAGLYGDVITSFRKPAA